MVQDARITSSAGLSHGGAAEARRRPRAVTFVAGLSVFEGIVAVLVGGIYATGWVLDADAMRAANMQLLLDGAALLTISGVALLVSAIGLLWLRSWAWTLAMATQCLTLTVTLYEYLSNDPDYLVMALGVLAVLLLNRQEVRVAFETAEQRRG